MTHIESARTRRLLWGCLALLVAIAVWWLRPATSEHAIEPTRLADRSEPTRVSDEPLSVPLTTADRSSEPRPEPVARVDPQTTPLSDTLFVKVVDRAGVPLAGSRVELYDKSDANHRVRSDLDVRGRIQLSVRAFATTDEAGIAALPLEGLLAGLVLASSPRHAPRVLWPPSGSFRDYAGTESPLLIELGTPATLTIVANRGGAPVSGVGITLLPFLEDARATIREPYRIPLRWNAQTDVLGRARFEDLPPDARIELRAMYLKIPQEIPVSPVHLDAGEDRWIDVSIAGAVLVHGFVRTASGENPGSMTLWVQEDQRRGDAAAASTKQFTAKDLSGRTRRVTSDDAGEFSFTGRPGTRVWVGPWALASSPQLRDWAPTARGFAIEEETSSITVVVEPACSISGVVKRESGMPVGDAEVNAESMDGLARVTVKTIGDGSFVFPSLPAGTYETWSTGTHQAPSSRVESVHLSQGETPVTLIVPETRELEVELRDSETDQVTEGEVMLFEFRSTNARRPPVRTDCGRARLTGVAIGRTYDIVARSGVDRIACVSSLTLQPEHFLSPPILRLAPGGAARITNSGDEPWIMSELWWGRTLIACEPVFPGSALRLSAPEGRLTVRSFTRGSPLGVQETNIQAGSETTVEVGR